MFQYIHFVLISPGDVRAIVFFMANCLALLKRCDITRDVISYSMLVITKKQAVVCVEPTKSAQYTYSCIKNPVFLRTSGFNFRFLNKQAEIIWNQAANADHYPRAKAPF